MYQIDQGPHMVDGSLGQNSVTKVEDVTGTPAGLGEDTTGLPLDLGQFREQDHRIEVPLHGDFRAKPPPGSIEIDPPVESNHRAAGVALQFKKRSRVGAKVNRRRGGVELGEQSSHVRLDEASIILGTEGPDPAIKDLDNLSTAAI